MSRKRPARKLAEVVPLGTADSVMDALANAVARGQEDEILAIGIVEVGRAGEIRWAWTEGHTAGLVLGLEHLKRHLVAGDA